MHYFNLDNYNIRSMGRLYKFKFKTHESHLTQSESSYLTQELTSGYTHMMAQLHPEEMIIPQLKSWLESRGAPTKGKKKDLIDR